MLTAKNTQARNNRYPCCLAYAVNGVYFSVIPNRRQPQRGFVPTKPGQSTPGVRQTRPTRRGEKIGDEMSTVDFNGRGWGVEPEWKTRHQGGWKPASRGVVEPTRGNIVVHLSSHTILRCSCEPQESTQTKKSPVPEL